MSGLDLILAHDKPFTPSFGVFAAERPPKEEEATNGPKPGELLPLSISDSAESCFEAVLHDSRSN